MSSGRTAFDVGTGTGVIAAVLARRGVARVVATDVDPRALACARENLERLGLAQRVEVVQADLYPDGRAARGAVPTRPYVTAVAFANLFHAVALFVIPAFHRLFKEVGVHLSVSTELVLTAAGVCDCGAGIGGKLRVIQ